MTLKHLFCMSVITIGVSTASLARQQEYRYAVLPLESLGGLHSWGHGLDDQGNAIGDASVPDPGGFHATIWFGGLGTPIDLGTLGGSNSKAWATNTSGWVVGRADLVSRYHACLWRDKDLIDLGTLGGDYSEAFNLNSQGHIVGWSSVIPNEFSPTHAFLWIDGEMTDLGTLDIWSSEARSINDAGQIVGKSFSDVYGEWRAVLWENGVIQDLGTLRANNDGRSDALDINDLGHIVGQSDVDQFNRRSAFLWVEGRMYDLGRLPGMTSAHAEGINNSSQVIGVSTREAEREAFIWEQSQGMRRLNDLIAPRARWLLEVAWDINDAGQITGWGERTYDPSRTVGYILSPVNPTMQLDAPIPGRAGEANSLTVSNCTPGASVTFLYSRHGGGERIPGCDLQQNALQLDSPTIIGTAIADGNGVATITRTVPPIARNQTILFQAVVQNECAISQLVVHQFE